MKILITSDLYTTATNGVVTSLKNLCGELEKKGHEVRILSFSNNKHSRKEGNVYLLRSLPFPVYPDIRLPIFARRHEYVKEIIAWKPDVIHSQCEYFSFGYAKYISKKTKAPIVHTYHTLYEQYVTYVIPIRSLGERLVRVFSRKRLKRTKVIIAPTYKVERTLRSYKIENEIAVVPSGISLEQYKMRLSPEERSKKRNELGISDDKKVLINLGRLGYEKNIDELITFFAKSCEKRDDLRFLIVGGGPAKESLEKHADKLGVADKVIFTGMVPPTEVQNYYQLGDLFVGASTSETQGLTYVEASACGLPLLCRKDLCLEGVIFDGKNGYEYTCEQEFLDYLDKIADSTEWRASASKKGEEISELFDKAHFGDSVEKLYNKSINV